MANINKQLSFLIELSAVFAKATQVFDRRLVGGLGFNDLIILYHISQSDDEKMRRIDLADKIGLSPSGVTRMLLPMEKLGMVKREADKRDARVSYVKLAPGGKRLLAETIEKAEYLAEEILPTTKIDKLNEISEVLGMFTTPR